MRAGYEIIKVKGQSPASFNMKKMTIAIRDRRHENQSTKLMWIKDIFSSNRV